MTQPSPMPDASTALPAWRLTTSIIMLSGVVLLWLLMISRAYDALYFEPTTAALRRAKEAQPHVRWFALASLLLIALLALAARRLELLLLATPALLILVFKAVSHDSATAILGVVATPFAISACLIAIAIRRVRPPHIPWTIVCAARLSILYAITLDALVAVLVFEQITGRGHLGAERLSGLSLNGLLDFTTVLLVIAVLLWLGATRLISSGRQLLIVVPLSCFMIIGTIGEIADLVGNASLQTDLTGLGILALSGLPVFVLATPRARRWRRECLPSTARP